MSEQKDKVYRFVPLSEYSLKQRIMIRLAVIVFSGAIRILGSLTRFEVHGTEHLEAIERSGKTPIYSFWHDRIFLSIYFWRNRGMVAMISKSIDGEYIARTIQHLGFGAIRGSSSRGGSKALVEMIKTMRSGVPMVFTPDGPRGPKYEAKPGPVFLAKKTGNPILPYVIEAKSFWRAKSWDSLHVPKPFTRAVVLIGEPIYVSETADAAEIDLKLSELQHSLDGLVESGKEWRRKN